MGKKNVTKYQIIVLPTFHLVESNFKSLEDAQKWITSHDSKFQKNGQLFIRPYTVSVASHNKKK